MNALAVTGGFFIKDAVKPSSCADMMWRRAFLLVVLLLPGWAMASAPRVTFLNPGYSNELFWLSVSEFMQAAADDLDMQLTVLYAERDHQRMVQQAREVLNSAEPPDYLVVVNETFVGPELLRLTQGKPVKLFMLLNTLTLAQQAQMGRPREKHPQWIGALVPDNIAAGRLIAQRLIEQARRQGFTEPLQLLALAGDNVTPAALEREQGLREALASEPNVQLQQLVYARWRRDKALSKSLFLLKRYPQAQLIWAANDQMAFGALDALRSQEKVPGQDVLVAALNNSDAAFNARINNEFAVLMAGHFTAGGWAMVLLYDYANGHDFAPRAGVELRYPLFEEVTPAMAKQLRDRLNTADYAQLNFKALSATHNPSLERYDFGLKHLLSNP